MKTKRLKRGACVLSMLSLCILCASALWAAEPLTGEQRLLVSPATLHAALEQAAAPVVIDARTKDAFDAGHIPGARWIDANAWREMTFTPTGLTDHSFWSKQLGAVGLTTQSSIVVVGDSLPEAARAWWLLGYLGMPKVGLLDGGHAAWSEAGYETSTDTQPVITSQPEIEFQSQRLAGLETIQKAIQQKAQYAILDNRSQAEFSGTRGVGTRTGHIPGATHFEWNRFVDKSGRFLPVNEIKSLLKDAGVDLSQPIVAHCQTGGRSSVAVLALELAGATQVTNYYRGWSEYSGVLTAPVEK